jgi:hypothetical protein
MEVSSNVEILYVSRSLKTSYGEIGEISDSADHKSGVLDNVESMVPYKRSKGVTCISEVGKRTVILGLCCTQAW